MGISNNKLITLSVFFIGALFLSRLFIVTIDQLNAPFDLIFETPNLCTIKLIKDGKNPYDPEIYSKPPFLITIYTPLYHYIAATLPINKKNPFLYGRILSLLAMFAAASALFLIPGKKTFLIFSILGFSLYFSIWTVVSNTSFLKNDSLALFFSIYAIVIIYRCNSSLSVVWASLFCILAVLSKQSYISAVITCFIYLLLSNRTHFFIFLASILILTAIVISIAAGLWGAGFWFSTISALQHPVSLNQGINLWKQMFRQPSFWSINIFFLLTLIPYFKKNAREMLQDAPFFLYSIVTFLILTITIGKIGSSTNYFFEFLLSELIWIVFILSKQSKPFNSKPFIIAGLIFLSAVSVFDIYSSKRDNYSLISQKTMRGKNKKILSMKNAVKSLNINTPLIMDLVRHNYLFSLSDNISLNDPFLYRLLWRKGTIDFHPFLNSIKHQIYDIIMLPKSLSLMSNSGDPFNQAVALTFQYYKIKTSGGGYYFLTRKPDAEAISR